MSVVFLSFIVPYLALCLYLACACKRVYVCVCVFCVFNSLLGCSWCEI